ncbi:MAG: hypothetical protein R3345_06735 [Fulvivirga sp.]|nr:hypothetical protein [Fulvivirga sp.]
MKYIGLFIVCILLFSCSSPSKDVKEFDEAAWQSDENGCDNVRLQMLDQLIAAKDQLKGLNQNEIQALLGKPDRHELYKRNQKFFYYQISPGKDCPQPQEENIYLSIRFNATGLSKEVLVMNYISD